MAVQKSNSCASAKRDCVSLTKPLVTNETIETRKAGSTDVNVSTITMPCGIQSSMPKYAHHIQKLVKSKTTTDKPEVTYYLQKVIKNLLPLRIFLTFLDRDNRKSVAGDILNTKDRA